MKQNAHGFTIVELLIVVVVISILAVIGMVAYNGISQRANNSAIISTASGTLRLIQTYIVQEGKYPARSNTAVWHCLTTELDCSGSTGNAITLGASWDRSGLTSIGSLPSSIPEAGGTARGIIYTYRAVRTIDGVSRPATLSYSLQGRDQNCGMSNVVSSDNNEPTWSTTGHSGNSDGNTTRCVVSIEGPAHI